MVDASRAVRLGFATLLFFGLACGEDDAPRTRPAPLSRPVASCEVATSDLGLRLPIWDLFVVDADWDALHADVRADVEVAAQVCIEGRLERIDLELQGTSGRGRDKKSFKLKFKRDQELARVGLEDEDGVLIDKVFLRAVWIDQSMIREAVAFDLWREMGHTAPRTGFANLRINGDYWGLYTVVEPVDGDYLRRNGYPEDGQLYKATRKHGSRADFAPGRNLGKAFEDKTGDDDDASRDDLARLVAALQETALDAEAFEREIDPILSLDDYIDRMIWVAYTRNGDAVAQNFYLYNAPQADRDRWYQIPWDSDLCMGASWRDRDAYVPADVSLMLNGGGNHFAGRLVKVPGLRERFRDRFSEVLDEILTEPVVLGHLELHAARVRQDLMEDQVRWRRNLSPDEAFEGIRQFVADRPDALRQGLEAMFAAPATAAVPVETADEPPQAE